MRCLLQRSLDGEDSSLELTKARVGLIKGWHQPPHYIKYHARMDNASFGDSGIFKPSGMSSSDGMSMSSRSYRYGVTYSKPSIAGISESEFMVP
jgi:hypothetical protein